MSTSMTTTASSASPQDDIYRLLADLDDNQIGSLLDDLNHTTPSNVPVSEAIVKFSAPGLLPHELLSKSSLADLDVFGASSPPRSTPARASSATLSAEFRRQVKRTSSAPEASSSRPRALNAFGRPGSPPLREAVPPVPLVPPVPAIELAAVNRGPAPRPLATPAPTLVVKKNREPVDMPPTIKNDAVSTSLDGPSGPRRRSLRPAPSVPELYAARSPRQRQQRALPPALPPLSTTITATETPPSLAPSAAPSPTSSVCPLTPPAFSRLASGAAANRQQSHHYKRISRPVVPLHPTKSSPDLRQLVAAYCDDAARPPPPVPNSLLATRATSPPSMSALSGFALFPQKNGGFCSFGGLSGGSGGSSGSGGSGDGGGNGGDDDNDDEVQLIAALLEPTPTKTPVSAGLAPTSNISGIFEVLDC